MPDYKSLYFKLFAAAADAVDAIERQDYAKALERLVRAEREAEEACIAEQA